MSLLKWASVLTVLKFVLQQFYNRTVAEFMKYFCSKLHGFQWRSTSHYL